MTRVYATWRTLRTLTRRLVAIWSGPAIDPIDLSASTAAWHGEPAAERMCTCSTGSSDHQAHMDDHEPGCRWLAIRCAPCGGSGFCARCVGTGERSAVERP